MGTEDQPPEEAVSADNSEGVQGSMTEEGATVEDINTESSSSESADSAEVARLKTELADAKDRYLRTLADFENLKKRSAKERSELLRYQGENIIVDLLEVLDGLERALDHAQADPGQVREGVRLLQKQFVDTLGKWEIKPESAIGKPFDPHKQRALGKVRVESLEPGTVATELKKAYFYRDKLIRIAEVLVNDEATGETLEKPSSSS